MDNMPKERTFLLELNEREAKIMLNLHRAAIEAIGKMPLRQETLVANHSLGVKMAALRGKVMCNGQLGREGTA